MESKIIKFESEGHTVRMEYLTNTAPVEHWQANADGSFSAFTYAANTLYVNKVYDENGNSVTEYKDKEGKAIIKENAQGNRTRFIFDDLNKLRCVMPPKATGPTERELCFYYRYDDKGRPIMKQIPGADSVLMVYDIRDRMALSQDGNMRAAGIWTFIKYDYLNRPVMTGLYNGRGKTRQQIQTVLDTIRTTSKLSETFNGDITSTRHGYSDLSFPVGIHTDSILTVTYYDQYPAMNPVYSYVNPVTLLDDPTDYTGFETTASPKTKGKITATKTKNLNTNQWLLTVTYYDKYGRMIQTIGDNHKGGTDRICNKYNFAGELLTTLQFHNISGKPMIKTGKQFTYDHAGRLLKTDEQIIGQSKITTSELKYNELGQLLTKGLHKTSDSTYLQNIAYKYNMRGWLRTLGSSLFNMELMYNSITGFNHLTSKENYNGNISAMKWTNGFSKITRGYGYEYDNLNRLTFGKYGDGADLQQHQGYYNELINEYDENGNIKKLQRKYKGILVDDLQYLYHSQSNQIQDIADLGNNTTEFKGFPISLGVYDYDANGNMDRDDSKGIVFSYNILNLPLECAIAGENRKVIYMYDAAGNKLQKKITDISGNPIKTTDYIGSFIYDTDGYTIQTAEGTIRFLYEGGAQHEYEYHLKDHLGNVRCVFTDEFGKAKVRQETNYYPFGAAFEQKNPYVKAVNKHLYNGKELQNDDMHPEANLDLLDYGARFYDPYVPPFSTLDPLAEKYYDVSPYAYCGNEPVNRIDQNGEEYTNPQNLWQEFVNIVTGYSFLNQGYTSNEATVNATRKGQNKNKESFIKDQVDRQINADAYQESYNQGYRSSGAVESVPLEFTVISTIVMPVSLPFRTGSSILNLAIEAANPISGFGVCFAKGTKVLTKYSYKKIEEVVVGDSVWSYNEVTKQLSLNRVTETFINYKNKLILLKTGSETVYVTPEHHIFVNNKWTEAGQIKKGDSLLLFNGKNQIVIDIIIKDSIATVYNFTVKNYHTYFVSECSFLVHNNPCSFKFPSANQLAKILGTTVDDFHKNIKAIMKKDFAKEMKSISTTNPDIGLDDVGNIILKNPKTGQTVETGIPLDTYKE